MPPAVPHRRRVPGAEEVCAVPEPLQQLRVADEALGGEVAEGEHPPELILTAAVRRKAGAGIVQRLLQPLPLGFEVRLQDVGQSSIESMGISQRAYPHSTSRRWACWA